MDSRRKVWVWIYEFSYQLNTPPPPPQYPPSILPSEHLKRPNLLKRLWVNKARRGIAELSSTGCAGASSVMPCISTQNIFINSLRKSRRRRRIYFQPSSDSCSTALWSSVIQEGKTVSFVIGLLLYIFTCQRVFKCYPWFMTNY